METPKPGEKWTAIKWTEVFTVEEVTLTHVFGHYVPSFGEGNVFCMPLSYFMLRYRPMTKLEIYLNGK